MYKFLYTIGLIISGSVGLFAQTLRLDLPYYQSKEVVLVQRQGVRNDTIGVVKLDTKGKANLSIIKAQGVGLGALLIGNEIQYPFVLSPCENALISSKNEGLTPQNTNIENSVENASLVRWGTKTAVLSSKLMRVEQLLPFYENENSTISKALVQEKNDLIKALILLDDTLKKSSFYAAKYLYTKSLLENTFKRNNESDTLAKATRKALLETIDIETLHRSDMWFEVLNYSLEIYQKEKPFYGKFGTDMVTIMKKTISNQVLSDLAEASISICSQFSWDKDQEVIVDYLASSNRITNLKGNLKKLFQMQAISVGKKAPDLILKEHIGEVKDHNHQTTLLKSNELSEGRSLLIFYQSGCGHCETTMNGLRNNYSELTKKGLRVVGISADTDEQVFRNTANSYPWKDSYSDMEGLKGINFKNYAVLGTPTMFLLDKNGNIEAKLATVEDVLQTINNY
jgi:thioredoxin-related protein